MPTSPYEAASSGKKGVLRSLIRKSAELPIWFCVATIAACLLLKEFYPFSNFPMYSKNAPSTFCLYVTDADGRVLFTLPEFGKLSSVLKKMFNGKIQKYKADGSIKRYDEMTAEQYQAVGGEILQGLLREKKWGGTPSRPGKLQLMREEFSLRDGKVVKETSKLAEISTDHGS